MIEETASASTIDDHEHHLLQLSPLEARVLGALMEKERATPEAYPLTLNALTNACNQKSSREPVMNVSSGEVGHALRQLQDRDLVRSESGSRSERFSQRLGSALGLNAKRQALMCLLLLRGPQTAAELLTRSARLADFEGAEELRLSLLKLIERPEPLVTPIARQSGQREERFAHRLSGEPLEASDTHALDQPIAPPPASELQQLRARVDKLERDLAFLQTQLGVEHSDEETGETTV